MPTKTYGQREPMENDAMEHTLETQARAIWLRVTEESKRNAAL